MRKTSSNVTKNKLFLLIVVVVLVSLACSTSQAEPTKTPLPAATNTQVPATATPEPSPTPDLAATESAQATEAAAQKVGEIDEILEKYGIDKPEGSLAWVQEEEVSISVFEYSGEEYEKVADEQVFENFILYSKVTWSSSSGLAGCDIFFRADQDMEHGDYYDLYLMRLSGYPAWALWFVEDGYGVNNLMGSTIRGKNIDHGQGATNEYILLVNGSTFTLYGNGNRQGGTSGSQLTKGQLAFGTWQESGETECAFNDSWVWAIE